ncbi:MAG: CdaR family protein [Oscillospiraceae bacterium]|nr:CdaR family protein [Oscillospiraceae bacterium]
MKSKRRKVFYILLSVLIASMVWFYVNNSEEVRINVHSVPVEFLNEDTTLADKGLMLVNGEEDVTVDLQLKVPRRLMFNFDTSQIRLVSDLSSITYAGKQSVTFNILFPSSISTRDVSVESPTVRTVQVEIGELQKRNIEIRYKVIGNVAEGYIAGAVQLNPAELQIRGQQADIMQVSYAQVMLNIENATSTVVELLDYQLYDYTDQPITNKNIHPTSEQIQVTMPVMTVKDVPLKINFVETAGSRLESFNWSLSHDSITLSGDASQIASIDEIELGTLALEDLRADEVFDYDIPIPEGVNNLSGITSVTLTIGASNVETREVEATSFSYENFNGSGEVTIVTSSLPVTLRGTAADLAVISDRQVRVIADLSDIAADSGSYTVPARIVVDGYDIGAVGNYEVTVRIGAAGSA